MRQRHWKRKKTFQWDLMDSDNSEQQCNNHKISWFWSDLMCCSDIEKKQQQSNWLIKHLICFISCASKKLTWTNTPRHTITLSSIYLSALLGYCLQFFYLQTLKRYCLKPLKVSRHLFWSVTGEAEAVCRDKPNYLTQRLPFNSSLRWNITQGSLGKTAGTLSHSPCA